MITSNHPSVFVIVKPLPMNLAIKASCEKAYKLGSFLSLFSHKWGGFFLSLPNYLKSSKNVWSFVEQLASQRITFTNVAFQPKHV